MLRYHTKPWKHQLEALKFLYPRNFGALYVDMGGGKTKIIIDLIVNRGFNISLIVCPKKVCRVWPKEFSIHAPNERICVLNLSDVAGKDKVGLVKETVRKGDFNQLVIIINYDSIWREPFKAFITGTGTAKLFIDAVICDESHRIKTPGSKVSKMLALLGKRVNHRYIMTGTPLAQSPLDIYAQYRFLAPEIFGTNFGNFRNRYANMIPLRGMGVEIIDKANPYKNLDELQEKMFSCAFKMDVELSLPETLDIPVEFEMSKEAQKYYKQLKEEGALELKEGDVTAGNVLAVITRLQQLCSGYLPTVDKKAIDIDSARRDALAELLEDIPKDEPVVIFSKFKMDLKNIRRVSEGLGRSISELSGSVDTMEDWVEGKTNILIVQISSGAEGINLTRARYNIYYTPTHSLSQYLQSRKRTHRPGQTRPVTYFKMVSTMSKDKTIDELIYQSLDSKQDVISSIMEGGLN